MTQPTPYDLAYDFVGFQVINPSRPLPAGQLEGEFNALKVTLDQILANLALIQRDDTELANKTVGYDQFKDELDLGFNPPSAWETAQSYSVRDTVFVGNSMYRCTVAHTSGVFANDLAASKWALIATFTAGGVSGAIDDLSDVVITAAASGEFLRYNGTNWVDAVIAQSDVTGLVAALAALQPLDSDLTAIAALTTTSFGRSLLTTADATALAALVDSSFLTPAEGNAAYQPLDSDLTSIAALATTSFGRSLLTIADATALAALVDSFFLTPAEGNAAYQPLDADLTSIAALSTTAFGRGLLTEADAASLAATLESAIEAAIDTLANLVSVQGHTVTLTGALIRSGAHSLTLTTTGTTTVTLPTSGTLQQQDELLDEIAALSTDPNADSGLFFDDSAGNVAYFTPTNGLEFNGTNLRITDNSRIAVISFVIDGGGSTITTGIKGDLEIPFACTITRATALADQSGSIVVDVWKDTYANYPPVDADSITASAPVTITTATKSQDSTLTGWTTSIAAGDTLRFNVDSVTTCQRCLVSLRVTKT